MNRIAQCAINDAIIMRIALANARAPFCEYFALQLTLEMVNTLPAPGTLIIRHPPSWSSLLTSTSRPVPATGPR